MVIVNPQLGLWDPFLTWPTFSWLIFMGLILTAEPSPGMILQVGEHEPFISGPWAILLKLDPLRR